MITSQQKALSSIRMALSGDTRKTWQYILSQLKALGHTPPEDVSLESWTLRTAKELIE